MNRCSASNYYNVARHNRMILFISGLFGRNYLLCVREFTGLQYGDDAIRLVAFLSVWCVCVCSVV